MSYPRLRLATEADLPAINDIYNYYIPRSTCTYQLEPETIEARRAWFAEHPPERYPVIVAELAVPGTPQRAFPTAPMAVSAASGLIAGWGSLSKFRERAAYAPTVEASVYIHHEHHRRGIGRAILVDLIERARAAGYHSLIGGASADQEASVALQESLGFKRVALLKEVGYKFGRWLDVVYLQLMLQTDRPAV
jgi:phosphinothricin acetyltransferase